MSSAGYHLSLLVSPFKTQDNLKVVGDSVGQTLPICGRLPATGVPPKPQPAGALLSRL